MRVLVTGANGHIGAHVVRALLDEGHEVRAFMRKSSNQQGLEGLSIEPVYGDVMDPASLEQAVEGCEAVIHLAAVYKTIAETADEIVAPAIQGAENLYRAAQKAGVQRIVYTSSVASVGFSYDPTALRTGDDWNDDPHNPYYIAKTRSEQAAQRLARETGIHTVVICPAIVLGPLDYRITPSNQLVMDWLNGVGQTYEGGLNLVDVRDVARAHVAALQVGENCRRYIVGGDNIRVRDIGETLARLTGYRPLHLPFNRSMTLLTARVVETFCRTFRISPPFTYDLLYEVADRYAWYDCRETYETFDFTPRGAEEVLKGSIEWLLSQGKIRPRRAQSIQAKLHLT